MVKFPQGLKDEAHPTATCCLLLLQAYREMFLEEGFDYGTCTGRLFVIENLVNVVGIGSIYEQSTVQLGGGRDPSNISYLSGYGSCVRCPARGESFI